MEYTYMLEVELAKPNISLNFTEKESYIKECISKYNLISYQMKNPKKLFFIDLTDKKMYLKLSSESVLTSAGRALRAFSVELLKDMDFSQAVSSNGQLIRVIEMSCEEREALVSSEDIAEITDLDFIKAILDYVYNPRDLNTTIYKKKKTAFEEMKKIAIEAGIIQKKIK